VQSKRLDQGTPTGDPWHPFRTVNEYPMAMPQSGQIKDQGFLGPGSQM